VLIRLLITILICLTISSDALYHPPLISPSLDFSTSLKMPIVLSIDPRFDPIERNLILSALEEWQMVSQGALTFQVIWDQPRPGNLNRPNAGFYIWAIDPGEKTGMLPATLKLSGLFSPNKNKRDRGNILMLERPTIPVRFFSVVVHEIGHMVGLSHNDSDRSVMHREATGLCFDKKDVEKLCNIYGCVPSSSCPFE